MCAERGTRQAEYAGGVSGNRARRVVLPAVVIVAAVALAGCTSQTKPAPVPAPTSASPTGGGSTPGVPATFHPDGSAADNEPFFLETISKVWASDGKLAGRNYIDALVAAGFTDKSAMQLSPDLTTIGDPVDTIQFSVRWKDQCLLGQVGPMTGNPTATVAPVLADGRCMFGTLRAIDW